MSLGSVNGKSFFYEKMNVRVNQKQKAKERSEDGFSENVKEMASKESETVRGQTSVQMDYSCGRAASSIWIKQDGRVNMNAVLECALRRISYSESDYVKAYVIEGYTLKAQVKLDEHMVYIEQKNEDGSSKAYEVNPLLVAKDTNDPIEQMAAEAWEKARTLFNDGLFTEIREKTEGTEDGEEEAKTFAEALDEFHAYVKKRIKEGPPKIQTGGSEFSQDEWERLLRKIDKTINIYKTELRKKLRELREGTEEYVQRGTSFLARLSGEKKAPYSYLADESGNIVYKGVVFVCDNKKQQICLGDMSNPNKVLNIPLSKGGVLRVNRDNLNDLVKAIDMFSPEDIARILRAIAQDKKIQDMELEIEEMKAESPAGGTSGVS